MKIDPVCRILDAIAAPYALIGAHAMAARGYPRFTVDIDLLTTDPRVLEREIWATLEHAGADVEPRRGDQDDPLAGVVHILLAMARTSISCWRAGSGNRTSSPVPNR